MIVDLEHIARAAARARAVLARRRDDASWVAVLEVARSADMALVLDRSRSRWGRSGRELRVSVFAGAMRSGARDRPTDPRPGLLISTSPICSLCGGSGGSDLTEWLRSHPLRPLGADFPGLQALRGE